MVVRSSQILGFVVVLAALLSSGCGDGTKMVKVEGKVVKGAEPFTVSDGQMLNLSFSGKGPKGEAVYAAEVNPDGSFIVNKAGGGVPPGKYKIHINLTAGGTDPASLKKSAALNKQFSAIDGKECEVTDAPQNITIDTAKGTIGK